MRRKTMTGKNSGLALAFAACLALAASCAGGAGKAALPAASARPEGWEATPASARSFMDEFKSRVESGDWSWVIGRADPDFAKAHPGAAPSDGLVLAKLLRSGLLAVDDHDAKYNAVAPLRGFDQKRVLYDSVRLKGPVVLVYGRLLSASGAQTPFALRILWRLEPPLILGFVE